MAKFRLRYIETGALVNLAGKLRRPEAILEALGAIGLAGWDEAFREQGRPKGSWPERMVPNIPGIIRDFQDTDRPSRVLRRFDARPAVVDTSRLKRTRSMRIVSRTRVEWGTIVPYADKQHRGLESESPTITPTVQRNLWSWLKTPTGSPHKKALGWLLNRNKRYETITIKIRERPLVSWLPRDTDDAREAIGRLLKSGVAA